MISLFALDSFLGVSFFFETEAKDTDDPYIN